MLFALDSLNGWMDATGDAHRTLAKVLDSLRAERNGTVTGFFRYFLEPEEKVSGPVLSHFDGEIKLTRDIAYRNIYPAIDCLESFIRYTGSRKSDGLRVEARELLRWYFKNENLIEIGAVKEGFNPKLDRAQQRFPYLRNFLCQGVFEKSELPETLRKLRSALALEG